MVDADASRAKECYGGITRLAHRINMGIEITRIPYLTLRKSKIAFWCNKS